MGNNVYKRVLRNSFFNKHQVDIITSVCPSTTTTSTTSMQSGKYPSEHNWLGWDVYIKPVDKIVTLYRNKVKDTLEDAADYNVANQFIPFDNIVDLINKNGYYAKELFPFGDDCYQDLDDMYKRIIEETNKDGKKYIYAYCTEPDHLMHEYGVNSFEAREYIKLINKKTKEMCRKLKNTLLIVVADHGHLNCEEIVISDYKDFLDTLDGDISIEARFCSFKVKDKNNFVRLYNKYFKNDFILKTHDEIINEQWLGIGEHKQFRDSIGDYILIAKSNKYFRYTEKSQKAVGVHAGITDDEMLIPLIVIEKE